MKENNPSTEYDLKKYYPDLYHKFHDEAPQKMYQSILKTLKGKRARALRKELNEEIIAKLTAMRTEQINNAEMSMLMNLHRFIFLPK